MNRLRKDDPNYDAAPEPTTDPTFDLRRGLMALVIFISIMVLLSLICAFLR
jgi:hypothetical protein